MKSPKDFLVTSAQFPRESAQAHPNGGEGLAGLIMEIACNTLTFRFLRRDHAPEQFAAQDFTLLRFFQAFGLQFHNFSLCFHLKGAQETYNEKGRGNSRKRAEHLNGNTKQVKECLLIDDIRWKNRSSFCKKLPKETVPAKGNGCPQRVLPKADQP